MEDPPPGSELAVAILGRPNVGKSSLLNALVGEERSIVSPVSGTTRDAVDTPLETPDGRKYLLVDTAGVRRRGKVAGRGDPAEQAAVEQSLQTLGRADVAVLVDIADGGVGLAVARCAGEDDRARLLRGQVFQDCV